MNDWKLINPETDDVKHFDSRSAAQEKKDEIADLFDAELRIEPVDTDGGTEAEVIEPDASDADVVEADRQATEQLPDDPDISEDPVDWLPGHFIDRIQGVPTVNRKGYAVIASKYGVSVEAEPVTLPSETEFEYAEFRAVATTEDGKTYTGFGSAHIARQDGDNPYLLGELAETRALKRAVSWATGVGMTAMEELQGNL